MRISKKDLEGFTDEQVILASEWVDALLDDPERRIKLPNRTFELASTIALRSMKDMVCRVHADYLVETLGMSYTTVTKIFNALQEEGWLVKVKDCQKSKGVPATYRLTIPNRLIK